MNNIKITEQINRLRLKSKKVITNCFFNLNSLDNAQTIISNRSVIILKKEYNVTRILFYTIDTDDLKENILKHLNSEKYTLEIISRDKNFLSDPINAAGFKKLSSLMRISNHDVTSEMDTLQTYKYFNPNIGKIASTDDAEEIFEILWDTFDTRISHLPDIHTLIEYINNKLFIIHRNPDMKITALLQAVCETKSFYINQIYNADSPDIIHAIVLNELTKYKNNGGKYIYSWVEESNIPSLKFHQKYNMTHDGLWNIVYTNY